MVVQGKNTESLAIRYFDPVCQQSAVCVRDKRNSQDYIVPGVKWVVAVIKLGSRNFLLSYSIPSFNYMTNPFSFQRNQ